MQSATAPDKKFFRSMRESVPVLGMGTWGMGGGFMSPDYSEDKKCVRALRRGIELGMTLIDTAEVYGGGHAEELVGEAIKGFPRSELFIVSKVWPDRRTRDEIVKAALASVKRLGTHMDLYLLHWPPEDGELKERMKGLEEVVKRGLTRYIGVSNFSVPLIEKARKCLSTVDIVAVQNRMSVSYRVYEKDVVPYAERRGMMFMAYTPLEKGRLATNPFLANVGSKYGKTAAQVALNWLICINPVVPIPKAARIEHVEENAGAMCWRLSKEDWKLIAEHFR